jgi:hypothetical protein
LVANSSGAKLIIATQSIFDRRAIVWIYLKHPMDHVVGGFRNISPMLVVAHPNPWLPILLVPNSSLQRKASLTVER